jgi:protein TonB
MRNGGTAEGRLAGGRRAVATAAPRWTLESVAGAALFTALTFLLMPYLERVSAPPRVVRLAGEVHAAKPPPVVRPLPERIPEPRPAMRRETPMPRLPEARFEPLPVDARLALDLSLPAGGGDFAVGFAVAAPPVPAAVEKTVFEVSEVDSAPQPLVRGDPVYPAGAWGAREEGVVELGFVVGEDGRTREIRVISSKPDDRFGDSAVQAVKRWRFKPGTVDGTPVAVQVRQRIVFRVEDRRW